MVVNNIAIATEQQNCNMRKRKKVVFHDSFNSAKANVKDCSHRQAIEGLKMRFYVKTKRHREAMQGLALFVLKFHNLYSLFITCVCIHSILRVHNFHPNYLKKSPIDEVSRVYGRLLLRYVLCILCSRNLNISAWTYT